MTFCPPLRFARRVRRATCLVALPWVLLSTPARAEASPQTMRLDYRRDAGAERCPDEQQFRDAVTARSHRAEPFDPRAAARLLVRLQRAGHRYEGTAEIQDEAGAATWQTRIGPIPNDCAAIVDSLASAVVVTLRLYLPAPAAPAPAPPKEPVPSEPPRAPEPLPPPALPRVRLGAGATADLWAAPATSFGLTAEVGYRVLPSFSVGLEGHFSLPAGGDSSAHIAVSRYLAALALCGHLDRYPLIACGLVEAGALHGAGIAMHPQSDTEPYAATGARIGLELSFSAHLAVRLALDGLVALARHPLRINERSPWTPSPGSASFGAGLVASF